MCISNIGSRRAIAANPNLATARPLSNDAAAFLARSMVKDMSTQQTDQQVPKTQNAHIIVQHNYHDHANDPESAYQEEHPARGGVTTPFPIKLHEMLDRVQADGHDHIVSWQPHGRCFVVHKPKEFVELLPSYFKLSKLASFQRQLNLYGFQRLTRGRDRGGYYHELFLHGKVFLAHNIQRIKVKGTGVRARSNPDQEPDFWQMPWVQQEQAKPAGNSTPPLAVAPMFNDMTVLSQNLTQLPLQLNAAAMAPAGFQEEQEDVCAFGDKTFHFLDPFQKAKGEEKPKWTVAGVDDLLASEADNFFEGFDFPQDIGAEIEDDDVFGDMLEKIIA